MLCARDFGVVPDMIAFATWEVSIQGMTGRQKVYLGSKAGFGLCRRFGFQYTRQTSQVLDTRTKKSNAVVHNRRRQKRIEKIQDARWCGFRFIAKPTDPSLEGPVP